jgi:Predicted nucleic acid-binding protein, contains PIN domain
MHINMPISNSSPLIHLARLEKLPYAKGAYDSVIIPPAVRTETIERGKAEGYADAFLLEKLESQGWLKTQKLSNESKRFARDLTKVVGRGEAEAISLAIELRERLFMDDHVGRRIASFYKVQATTTLGILLELLATKAITISEYRKNVKVYASQGWISADILQYYLEKGEEYE